MNFPLQALALVRKWEIARDKEKHIRPRRESNPRRPDLIVRWFTDRARRPAGNKSWVTMVVMVVICGNVKVTNECCEMFLHFYCSKQSSIKVIKQLKLVLRKFIYGCLQILVERLKTLLYQELGHFRELFTAFCLIFAL